MTIKSWLKGAQTDLESAGIGTARLDALVLLEDVTKCDRAKLLAEPDLELTATQHAKLKKLLSRRAAHEPLAYIRGFTEFYGRRFVITPAVLEPRPESETMIDLLQKLIESSYGVLKQVQNDEQGACSWSIADVGAGSGALGISAKFMLPSSQIDLFEIDSAATKVAQRNVDLFTLSIDVIKSDLLTAARHNYDILLCNLPYVPESHHINQAAAQEPKIAIFGGPDGLNVYRKLFQQLKIVGQNPLYILCESLPSQHNALKQIAESTGYSQIDEVDFIQVFTPTTD